MTLTTEQNVACQLALANENLSICGAAGSGKSHVIGFIQQKLEANRKTVALTAVTGVAASNLKGATTVHCWAGFGLGMGPIEKLVKKIRKKAPALENWVTTDTLIIDEFSMMSVHLFHVLDDIARILRGKPGMPFGGMQVILVGDPNQLPPVAPSGSLLIQGQYCFQSPRWADTMAHTVRLKHIFRQDGDARFKGILESVAAGSATGTVYAALRERIVSTGASNYSMLSAQDTPIVTLSMEERKTITHLFSRNTHVDAHNQIMFSMLPAEAKAMEYKTSWEFYWTTASLSRRNPAFATATTAQLKNISKLPEIQHVKVGMYVMMNMNIDPSRGWANGTMGLIVGFVCRSPVMCKNLYLAKKWLEGGRTRDYAKHEDCLIIDPYAECEQMDVPGGMAVTKGLPLNPAWAITIHKSQGSQYPRVCVRLDDVFEAGQVYVALSRCTRLDGLYIDGALPPPRFFKPPKAAVAFYKGHYDFKLDSDSDTD